MSKAGSRRGTPAATRKIRINADLLSVLPDPPETFYAADVPGDNRGTIESLYRVGAVEKVGWDSYDEDDRWNDRREYRLRRWANEVVEETIENRDAVCPCGHGGMRNRGDYYECAYEPCDQEFDRDELEVDA